MATAFGLDIESQPPLALLSPARACATGRRLRIDLAAGERAASMWPTGARIMCQRSDRAGAPLFTIQEHPRAGYRLWGRDSGAYLLSADARTLVCAPRGAAASSWERFLVGQVLPFAALVSGLEIFHASAVVLDGGAIALSGPSGAGKTSLALALCRLGAGFLADDVLALEPTAGALIAHPGTPVAGVDRREDARLREAGNPLSAAALGGDARERLLAMAGETVPAPLRALFFLDRSGEPAEAVRFDPIARAPLLLAATFNFALDSRPRMRGLLDVCALAAQQRVERVTVPPGHDAGEVAAAVLARMRGGT